MYLRGTWGTGVLPVAVDDAENDAIRALLLANTNGTLLNDKSKVAITTIGVDGDKSNRIPTYLNPQQLVLDYIDHKDPQSQGYIKALKRFNTAYAGHNYIVSTTHRRIMLADWPGMSLHVIQAITIAICGDQRGAVLCRPSGSPWQWREMSLDELAVLNVKHIIRMYSAIGNSYLMEVATSGRKCKPRRTERWLPSNRSAHSKSIVSRIFSKVAHNSDVYIFSANPLVMQQMHSIHLRLMDSFVPQDLITVHLYQPADEDGLTYDGDVTDEH
jgi:hypothetical protein